MAASPVNVRTELVEALRLDLVGPSNNHPFAHELLHEPPKAVSKYRLGNFPINPST